MQDRTNFTWIYQGDFIPSVIIPHLQTNQAGTYEVLAENFCGSVLSSSSMVGVSNSPFPVSSSLTTLVFSSHGEDNFPALEPGIFIT
jgi:hypothetical protein